MLVKLGLNVLHWLSTYFNFSHLLGLGTSFVKGQGLITVYFWILKFIAKWRVFNKLLWPIFLNWINMGPYCLSFIELSCTCILQWINFSHTKHQKCKVMVQLIKWKERATAFSGPKVAFILILLYGPAKSNSISLPWNLAETN